MLLELADWMARHFTALHLFQYITFRTIMVDAHRARRCRCCSARS